MTLNSRRALGRAIREMVSQVPANGRFQMTGGDFRIVRFSCTGLAELPAHEQYDGKLVKVDFIPRLTTEFSRTKKLPYTQVPFDVGMELYLADPVHERGTTPRWQEIDHLDDEEERLSKIWMDGMMPHCIMDVERDILHQKLKVCCLWIVATDLIVQAGIDVDWAVVRTPSTFPALHPGSNVQMETLQILVDTMVLSTEHLFTARNKAQAFWLRAIGEAWDAMMTQTPQPHSIRLDEHFYVLNLKPRSIGTAPAIRDPDEGKSKTERTVRRKLL